jgi:demethylmenaquinone methyltransferase/2-methoxy-6-polyprenyl-1,4-benzoquinol methylase
VPEKAGREHGILDAQAIQRLYDQLAPSYDALASVYRAVGSRRLAERGMRLLDLRPGDTAVDLGCGTGVNLPELARLVGPTGRVVGIDLSPQMLARARERITRAGFSNVELVQGDVRGFAFPDDLHGVMSTFALEMVPEHDEVIGRACRALSVTGGRIAVMGLRRPPSWPRWAVDLGIAIGRPFGVSDAYVQVRPWKALRRHTDEFRFETKVCGALYLAVGRAR